MIKKSRKKFKYLENKKSFKGTFWAQLYQIWGYLFNPIPIYLQKSRTFLISWFRPNLSHKIILIGNFPASWDIKIRNPNRIKKQSDFVQNISRKRITETLFDYL